LGFAFGKNGFATDCTDYTEKILFCDISEICGTHPFGRRQNILCNLCNLWLTIAAKLLQEVWRLEKISTNRVEKSGKKFILLQIN
jgi:hypothetical protein